MGMLVDLSAIQGALALGLVFTLFAIVGKVVGTGVPAMAVGFNFLGGLRVGVGMLPRAEVALTIAGIGLSRGIIGVPLFSACVMMVMVTALLAPILLVPLFRREGSGWRGAGLAADESAGISFEAES